VTHVRDAGDGADAAATAAPERPSEVEQCVINLLHALSEDAPRASAA
jgi:hypothetical protein